MTREEELSRAGSGACHKLVGYIKGGWNGKKGTLGGGDQNGRDHPGAAGRCPRGEAHKEGPPGRVGPGEQRRPGSGPYQPRVRALGTLFGAPSRKRNKREPGRILGGRARPRAPRSLRSRRRRSRSPAASCPPARPGSGFPDSKSRLAQKHRLPPPGSRLRASASGRSGQVPGVPASAVAPEIRARVRALPGRGRL